MDLRESSPRAPDEAQRLAARQRPPGPPVMYQQWRDLLFLHWEFSIPTIQATLPEGLFVDTFDGKAYLGVVPFFMCNIRPRFLPAVPGISNFMELNLRTYVHDRAGVPGVWFYSLDANQPLAVAAARRFFHLPYHHAKMRADRFADGSIHYSSTRASNLTGDLRSDFEYAAGDPMPSAQPGSLEFFLLERYHLYAKQRGRLARGTVAHQPYPLCHAELMGYDENLLKLDGFFHTGRPPDHFVMSPGVDVSVFPLGPC